MSSSYQLNDKARRKRASRSLQALRSGNDVERVVFFSDAVFAIAMTLLVLDLKLPALDASNPNALADALRERSPAFVGFALSFWIVASLWHGHHDRFARLVRYDNTFVTLNLGLLFFVAFLPVPTALMFTPGTGHSGLGPALYAGAIGMAFLMLDAEWWWAYHRGMLSAEVTRPRFRRALLGVLPMTVVFLASVPVALLTNDLAAFTMWMIGMPGQFVIMYFIERSCVNEQLRHDDALEGEVPRDAAPEGESAS